MPSQPSAGQPGENQHPFIRAAQHVGAFLGVEQRGIGVQYGVATIAVHAVHVIIKARNQWRQPLFQECQAGGTVLGWDLVAEKYHLSGMRIGLDHLESQATDFEDFEKAILVAEITDFPEALRERLLAALGIFIESKRFATDEDTTTLLGSAIRKYAMNMDPAHFDRYPQWLLPSATEYLKPIVELELVKGVSWRLTFEPISVTDGHPLKLLIDRLAQLYSDYIQPRLIVQKNYAATAVEATTALVLLHTLAGSSEMASKLLDDFEKKSPA